MILCSNGERFDGQLKFGQVWVKGKLERKIVDFDKVYMVFQTKKDIENNTYTRVYRSSFRDWVYSGAALKVD